MNYNRAAKIACTFQKVNTPWRHVHTNRYNSTLCSQSTSTYGYYVQEANFQGAPCRRSLMASIIIRSASSSSAIRRPPISEQGGPPREFRFARAKVSAAGRNFDVPISYGASGRTRWRLKEKRKLSKRAHREVAALNLTVCQVAIQESSPRSF